MVTAFRALFLSFSHAFLFVCACLCIGSRRDSRPGLYSSCVFVVFFAVNTYQFPWKRLLHEKTLD